LKTAALFAPRSHTGELLNFIIKFNIHARPIYRLERSTAPPEGKVRCVPETFQMLGRIEKYFDHEGIRPPWTAQFLRKKRSWTDLKYALPPHILVGTENSHENSRAA